MSWDESSDIFSHIEDNLTKMTENTRKERVSKSKKWSVILNIRELSTRAKMQH